MKRLIVLAVLCALLAGTVSRVASGLASLADSLQNAAALIDVQIQAIPVPAVTPADRAALGAWRSARQLVDQAIADPTPSRVAGLIAKADKTLAKTLGPDPAAAEILDALTDGLLAGTAELLADVRAAVTDMPAGAARDALLAKLDTADSLLAEAQGQATPAGARALAGRALKIAASVEKARRRKLLQLVSVRGLVVFVDGVRSAARSTFSGIVAKDGATGKALGITVEWRWRERPPSTVEHTFWLRIDPTHLAGDPPGGVPARTLEPVRYPVNDVFVAAAYTRRVGTAGTTQVDSVTGSVSLFSIDVRDTRASAPGFGRGRAAGFFEFTGREFGGPGTAPVVHGSFNVRNLMVLPPPGPIPLKAPDR